MPAVLALLLAAPITLKRTPKVDDKAMYAMGALIDLGGQDDVRFTGSLNERVKSVEGDTVTTAVESRVSVEVLGVVRQGAMIQSDRVEKLDGTTVSPGKMESTLLFAGARVDRLRTFYLPPAGVEIGEGWWRTEKRNDGFKAPPFSSFLKLEGEEKMGKRDVWRASVDANEADEAAPVHVKGMVWLDKADGSLVKGQWTISGYVHNANTPAMTARYELTRVEIP